MWRHADIVTSSQKGGACLRDVTRTERMTPRRRGVTSSKHVVTSSPDVFDGTSRGHYDVIAKGGACLSDVTQKEWMTSRRRGDVTRHGDVTIVTRADVITGGFNVTSHGQYDIITTWAAQRSDVTQRNDDVMEEGTCHREEADDVIMERTQQTMTSRRHDDIITVTSQAGTVTSSQRGSVTRCGGRVSVTSHGRDG